MNREEFKKKMREIKRQMEEILFGIENHDAYIFNNRGYRHFHYQVQEYIDRINYILDNCDARNTSEVFHENSYKEFCGCLKFVTEKWNRAKDYRYIDGKVCDKNGREKTSDEYGIR